MAKSIAKPSPLPMPFDLDLNTDFQMPSTPLEQALTDIWKQVLRLEHIGIQDNFFELGGDSILSIQIIARANQAGLRLTPRQVFQHQTIASLAAVAGTESVLQAPQHTLVGEAPLTPIQHWFFEQAFAQPHHFNQARLLQLRERVPVEIVGAAVSALVVHHDALRLRFEQVEGQWHQRYAQAEEHDFFSVVDLCSLPEEEHSAAITSMCSDLQSSLNLSEGPLLRVCYFEMGADHPARLLIAIHHLVVDGVSWRVLLEDLATGIGQLSQGTALSLPAKTTSYAQWGERLAAYANTSELSSELGYWEGVVGSGGVRLPVDIPSGVNTSASERVVRVWLDESETRSLLTEVPAVYHTQINDVLLTGLAQVLSDWTGSRRVLLALEGHGREALFEEVDVSRTVGWFTSVYPVLLEWPASGDVGDALKGVKESLRGVPKRGIGYGVLRYLSSDLLVREALSGAVVPLTPNAQRLTPFLCPEVSFNYHGQFDADQGSTGLLGTAREFSGAVHSTAAHRSYLLDVIGQVVQGRLQMAFVYSEAIHARSTVERLAADYVAALRDVISHCASPDSGGYTPSDFPEATVSQKSLDRLLSGIRKK